MMIKYELFISRQRRHRPILDRTFQVASLDKASEMVALHLKRRVRVDAAATRLQSAKQRPLAADLTEKWGGTEASSGAHLPCH